MRKILAIDPSLSGTAMIWGNGFDGFDILTAGGVATGKTVADRVRRYRALVDKIIEPLTGSCIKSVYIEGYSMGSKGMAITSICEYGGILRDRLLAGGFGPIYEVAPSTLKKFATGKGNAPKDMVAAHLTKRYGVLLKSNDEYDAFGIYQLGLMVEGVTEPTNDAQREAVAKVREQN